MKLVGFCAGAEVALVVAAYFKALAACLALVLARHGGIQRARRARSSASPLRITPPLICWVIAGRFKGSRTVPGRPVRATTPHCDRRSSDGLDRALPAGPRHRQAELWPGPSKSCHALKQSGDPAKGHRAIERSRAAVPLALAIDERSFGWDHPNVGTDLNNLATRSSSGDSTA